jgi:transcription elongation factor SPT5
MGRYQRDSLIGQTVVIVKGPYKGYMGIVKDTTDVTASVELHTDSRMLNVEKSKLVIREWVCFTALLVWVGFAVE